MVDSTRTCRPEIYNRLNWLHWEDVKRFFELNPCEELHYGQGAGTPHVIHKTFQHSMKSASAGRNLEQEEECHRDRRLATG
mmetsp:Transcript_30938/g.69446  ORF Transcript_30938/g.69446 Transcript_30938/m.69446 type:complete len:81 (-) Transcript_30938:1326-1568(-)